MTFPNENRMKQFICLVSYLVSFEFITLIGMELHNWHVSSGLWRTSVKHAKWFLQCSMWILQRFSNSGFHEFLENPSDKSKDERQPQLYFDQKSVFLFVKNNRIDLLKLKYKIVSIDKLICNNNNCCWSGHCLWHWHWE